MGLNFAKFFGGKVDHLQFESIANFLQNWAKKIGVDGLFSGKNLGWIVLAML